MRRAASTKPKVSFALLHFSLMRTNFPQYGWDGSKEDSDVQKDRPLLNVMSVECYHLFKTQYAAPPTHLP